MPKKPSRKPKTRSRKPKPRQKQKQKQKQVQKVSVNVSGGGSGSGGFIPIPQAPSFDYAALASLIRPAATVDMPIRAAAPVAEAPFVRPAEPPSLAFERLSSQRRPTSQQSAPFIATPAPSDFPSAKMPSTRSSVSFEPSESESDVPFRVSKAYLERPSSFYRSSGFIPPTGEGSGKKTKYEEDIFGRSMPTTSDIRGSSSFEVTGGGRKKPNIVSYLDLPSGGESETFGQRAFSKMGKKK